PFFSCHPKCCRKSKSGFLIASVSNDQLATFVGWPWLVPPSPAWKPNDFWVDLPLKNSFWKPPPLCPTEPEDSVPVSTYSYSPSPVGRTSMRYSFEKLLAPPRPSIWI